MSAGHNPASARNDGHGHEQYDGSEIPHGSFQSYMTGFVLSVILTAIPFFLVMARPIDSAAYTAAIVLACALVQILVHMIYFLHMTPKAEGGWLLLSTAFTIVVLVITLAGSIWIVFHLNNNMMPQMPDMPGMSEVPVSQ
jgi:cytochrome o ubiquinol oxidase operon protein cyoD